MYSDRLIQSLNFDSSIYSSNNKDNIYLISSPIDFHTIRANTLRVKTYLGGIPTDRASKTTKNIEVHGIVTNLIIYIVWNYLS